LSANQYTLLTDKPARDWRAMLRLWEWSRGRFAGEPDYSPTGLLRTASTWLRWVMRGMHAIGSIAAGVF
jgi:hypothetical protein